MFQNIVVIVFSIILISCGASDNINRSHFSGITPASTSLSQAFSFYGISWRGTPSDNLRFAHEAGYPHLFYQLGMENEPLAKNIGFYIEEPERDWMMDFPSRVINTQTVYTAEQKAFYEKYFCWKSNEEFPKNMAPGWYYNDQRYDIKLDLQQQEVIDEVVSRIVRKISFLERRNEGFLFSGFAWDEPNLDGSFYAKIPIIGGYTQVNLSYWTGKNSCLIHNGIKHDYETYPDGRAALYKKLFAITRAVYPEMKVIMEPYKLWDDWVKYVKDRADRHDINADLLSQESYGTEFLDEARLYETDIVKKELVGSSSPDMKGEDKNRLLAGKTAANGSWFNWFGRFGGSKQGDMPDYQNVFEVPARLKLVRLVPNWENLNNIPLTQRSFNGVTYQSPMSTISGDVIFSRRPDSSVIYSVFLTRAGQIRLKNSEKVTSIKRAGTFFEELEDSLTDFDIMDGVIKTTDRTRLEEAYIIHVN